MNVNQLHFSAPCEEHEDCVRLSTESLMHCIHETNKIIIFEEKFISQFCTAIIFLKKTASGYDCKVRKCIQLTVQTVQRPRRFHGLPAGRLLWFHRASPRDRKLCVCVFWSVLHTATSIQSRAFGHDYLSNSISEALKTLIPQSDKIPILIMSPSRTTRRSPWKIQSKCTNQNRQKVYKRGEKGN